MIVHGVKSTELGQQMTGNYQIISMRVVMNQVKRAVKRNFKWHCSMSEQRNLEMKLTARGYNSHQLLTSKTARAAME